MDLTPPTRREPAPAGRLPVVIEWVSGKLRDRRVEQQLTEEAATNPGLRDEVDWARRLLQVATDLPLHDPPELLHQRLRQQFRRWSAEQALAEPTALELLAVPVFNSHHSRLKLAVRRAGTDEGVQHLVWRTEPAELIIQARMVDDEHARLDGQVLLASPPGSTSFEVTVEGPGFRTISRDGDEFGRFSVVVPRTVTGLSVSIGDLTLVAQIQLSTR